MTSSSFIEGDHKTVWSDIMHRLPHKPLIQSSLLIIFLSFGLTSQLRAQAALPAFSILDAAPATPPALLAEGQFGYAVANLGDLDGDGINEVGVGAPYDYDQAIATHTGALWILYFHASGMLRESFKLVPDSFTGTADPVYSFGTSVVSMGDLDDDGIPDIAVGDPEAGTVWILTLQENGQRKFMRNMALVNDAIINPDHPQTGAVGFGQSVAALGDVDGNGVTDLAVGDPLDQSVWVVFLDANLAVINTQKIDASEGGFTGEILPEDAFGKSLAHMGDIDGDGAPDLAIGAPRHYGDSANKRGVVWLLNLNADGTVKSHSSIFPDTFSGTAEPSYELGGALNWTPASEGEFAGTLRIGLPGSGVVWRMLIRPDGSYAHTRYVAQAQGTVFSPDDPVGGLQDFGHSVARIGDLNGDGLDEYAVGDPSHNEDEGRLWVFSEDALGRPHPPHIIDAASSGNIHPPLDAAGQFGTTVVAVGDLDGDGVGDLAVGEPGASANKQGVGGALWLLHMDPQGGIKQSLPIREEYLHDVQDLGRVVGSIGDFDGNGVRDLAVGNPTAGRVRLFQMTAAGKVQYNFFAILQNDVIERRNSPELGEAGFGSAVTGLGDVEGNGGTVIAVGDPVRQHVWLMFFDKWGTYVGDLKIAEGWNGFAGDLGDQDEFGFALANLGDIDGNGVNDLGVGAPGDHTLFHPGAVWVLLLSDAGQVIGHERILADQYFGTADPVSPLGKTITSIGDQNGDGIPDMAVGIPDRGTIALFPMKADGRPHRGVYIARSQDGIVAPDDPMSGTEGFGSGIANMGDTDGDGWAELAVGSPLEAEGETLHPNVWAVNLDIPRLRELSSVSTEQEAPQLPAEARIGQNYPNPFHHTTSIRYELASSSTVQLAIYDVLGREQLVLVDGVKEAGVHEVQFNAEDWSSGMYFYRFTAGNFRVVRTLVVAH